jgi:hypothetical protein
MPYSWRKSKGEGFGVANSADDLLSDKGFFR